jgi:transcriptional regulator with XRE-family HTH domain
MAAEDVAVLPADRALMERIGARLRDLRERADLTQDEVGERAGFGGKYVGEIEKGIRDVPLSTLRAVAEAGLGVRLETVFSDAHRRKEPLASVPLPRDVEITASMISSLPMSARRPLLALVEVMVAQRPASRAAERTGPRWKSARRRKR